MSTNDAMPDDVPKVDRDRLIQVAVVTSELDAIYSGGMKHDEILIRTQELDVKQSELLNSLDTKDWERFWSTERREMIERGLNRCEAITARMKEVHTQGGK